MPDEHHTDYNLETIKKFKRLVNIRDDQYTNIFSFEHNGYAKSIVDLYNSVTDWSKTLTQNILNVFPSECARFALHRKECTDNTIKKFKRFKNFCNLFDFAFHQIVYDCLYNFPTKYYKNFVVNFYSTMNPLQTPEDNLNERLNDRYELYMYDANVYLFPIKQFNQINHSEPTECEKIIRDLADENGLKFVSLPSAICHWRKRATEEYISSKKRNAAFEAKTYITDANKYVSVGDLGEKEWEFFTFEESNTRVEKSFKHVVSVSKNQPHTITTYFKKLTDRHTSSS